MGISILLAFVMAGLFAVLGAWAGQLLSEMPDAMYGVMFDTAATLEALAVQVVEAIKADPLGMDWSLPGTKLGAMIAGIIPLCVWMFALIAMSRNDRAGEEHGSARWGSIAEMRKFMTLHNPNPDNAILFTRSCGMALSREEFDMRYNKNANVIVVGGSGSGKTRYYVKPNVCQLNGNYIITDPKGTLLPEVGQMLVDAGYEVRCFNTLLPGRSMVYNPLEYVRTDSDIIKFVEMYFDLTKDDKKTGGDKFWDDAAQLLLGATIAYLRDYALESDYNMRGLMTMLGYAEASEGNENFKSPLDRLFEQIETGYRRCVDKTQSGALTATDSLGARKLSSQARKRIVLRPSKLLNRRTGEMPYRHKRKDSNGNYLRDANNKVKRGYTPDEDFALKCYTKFKTASGKTLKSIIISVQSKFNLIDTGDYRPIVDGKDEMMLDQIGERGKKTALFLVFDDADPSFGFMHGMIIYQALQILTKKTADEKRFPGGRLPVSVNMLLDEYRSLNLPKDISGKVSVIRSRNINMSIILQSLSQLNELYEEASANSITDCCDSMLFLGGKSEKTTKTISDAIGQQTIQTSSFSTNHGGNGGGYTRSQQAQGRALIDQAEVGKLPGDEAILLITGSDPVKDKKYPLEQHRRYGLIDPGHKSGWYLRSPIVVNSEATRLTERVRLRFPVAHSKARPAKYKELFDVTEYIERRRKEMAEERAREKAEREAAEASGDGGEAHEAA